MHMEWLVNRQGKYHTCISIQVEFKTRQVKEYFWTDSVAVSGWGREIGEASSKSDSEK